MRFELDIQKKRKRCGDAALRRCVPKGKVKNCIGY
jgi:hypothetical protein